jgi:serine/threonine protein phosphatase 1
MRTIVIGDIHGCYDELKELIATLERECEYDKNTDKLIFLGDYIDRGDNSRLVIEYIRNLQKDNKNVIALMGNHEDMLLQYLDDGNPDWQWNGYLATMKSYEDFEGNFQSGVFKSDVEWIRSLPLYHEDKHCIYVHAGIDPYKPMKKQNRNTLLWVRDNFIYSNKKYHKTVIFGHTPTANISEEWMPVRTYNNNIDIDTGCVYGGALTALILEDGEVDGFYRTESKNQVVMY